MPEAYTGRRKLRSYLKRHDLSYADCARGLGVSRVTVYRYVKDGDRPSTQMCRAIETWTSGEIKLADWPPEKDRRKDKRQVEPHRPGLGTS